MGTNLGTVPLEVYTRIAGVAILEGQPVELTAAANTVAPTTGNAFIHGVAMHDAAAGEAVSVMRQGQFARALSAGAIGALNTSVTPGNGGFIAAVGSGTEVISGINLTTTAGASERFVILLDAAGRLEPA